MYSNLRISVVVSKAGLSQPGMPLPGHRIFFVSRLAIILLERLREFAGIENPRLGENITPREDAA